MDALFNHSRQGKFFGKFTNTCSVSSNVFRTTTHGTMHKTGKPEINSEQGINIIYRLHNCDSR